jgi:alkylation response protein AidB-like acyl-CoA dehydrogenase
MDSTVNFHPHERNSAVRGTGDDSAGFTQGLEEELIAKVREIRPLLRKNAPLGEAQRSLTDEVVRTLDQLDVWALITPRRWGGKGLSSAAFSRINREISKGDPSVAWVVQIINGCTWIATLTSDRLQEELFGQGLPKFCSSFAVACSAKAAPRGYIVDGTWPYNSGCRQASWGYYLVNLEKEDGTIQPGNFVYIPMKELQIKDTWHTVGMQGTSSDSVVADSVFVPEHRFVSVQKPFGDREPGKKHVGAASDNWQTIPLIRAAGLGQLVGAIEAALELTIEGALKKAVPNTTYAKQSNSQVVQRNLGEAAAKIDAAALSVDSLCDVQDQAALAGRQFSPLERSRQKAGCALVIDLLSDAIRLIMNVAGSGAFAKANEIQRFWRDFGMASRHAIFLPDFGYEVYGAMRLGVDQKAVLPHLV